MQDDHKMKDSRMIPPRDGEKIFADHNDITFYQKLLNTSHDVLCSIDASGKFIYVSDAASQLWGYDPNELIGTFIIDLIAEEDKILTSSTLNAIKAGVNKTSFHNYCNCKNGYTKAVTWSMQWDNKQQVIYSVAKDVTKLHLMQNERQSLESRLRRAYNLAGLSWWEYDINTQMFTFPEEVYMMYGQPIPTKLQTSLQDFLLFVHPEDVDKLLTDLAFINQDTYVNYKHRIIKSSGQVINVIHYVEVIRDIKERPIRIVGAVQDITKQKQAEEALRLSEHKYKLLFNQSLLPKLIFNVDTLRITEVNDAALKLYGYSRLEFLELTIIDLRPAEDQQSLYDAIERYKNQRDAVFTSFHRHKKKSGELFFVQIEASLIELSNGMHSLVLATDMTEKLQMQQRIISEKVTAQKEIARAIIQTQEKERQEIGKELHDNVNQILTTIKLYIENIKSYPEHQASFIDKSVILTQKAINELRLLSKQLVTPVINDLNFKAAILEIVDHYRSLNLFRIEYVFDLDEEQLDQDMQLTIYRIIQEQLNNIVKHAKASLVTITVTDDEHLNLSIVDNGIGFDIAKKGKGMGLNNIKNRAEIFKGKVYIETAIGMGCSLNIAFPNTKPC
ncbi:MAG TPA: PAS domain S-box protein [Flavisolibacter sp.]|nr:PAS domain S-box protein [Flavisolibacter sp.]